MSQEELKKQIESVITDEDYTPEEPRNSDDLSDYFDRELPVFPAWFEVPELQRS